MFFLKKLGDLRAREREGEEKGTTPKPAEIALWLQMNVL